MNWPRHKLTFKCIQGGNCNLAIEAVNKFLLKHKAKKQKLFFLKYSNSSQEYSNSFQKSTQNERQMPSRGPDPELSLSRN